MKQVVFILLLLPLFMHAQECDCTSSFNWLKETFETNDAGFPVVIKTKGTDTYQNFSDSIAQQTKQIQNHTECVKLLDEWTHFFRKGHVGVYYTHNPDKNRQAQGTEAPKPQPKIWPVDTTALFKKLKDRKPPYGICDVWYNNNYKMVVVPDTINAQRDYVGVLLWTNKPQWKAGQVKTEFSDSGSLVNYYMADHTLQKQSFSYSLKYLKTGNFHWTRSTEYVAPEDTAEFSIYMTEVPRIKQINNETVLMRIPSFNYKYKEKIDNLIAENQPLLDSTQNLIIDVRGNGGGADRSFKNITPFLYTQPMKFHNIEIRSTPMNIAAYKKWFSKSFLQRVFFGLALKRRLKKNMGEYVAMTQTKIRTIDNYDPKPYPENVYVIADEGCASSTEQFLLMAEQSSKTTIVGKTTFGAIDVSNVNTVMFPNNKYRLNYATSRSLRIPGRIIDDIGIAPDIIIPDTIQKYRWLRYIEKNLLTKH
ncbi:MAG TPA: S41 family peptidase [Salinivirga sp.]|uniref:S41 family peptidase n=1 Tax=Salinivirga sp. TaxID=1970192 RepID=UPI002B4977B2|nr:S41 family peptidase [Salinivirga sp.]HKK59504.1 S41 family peptidase [Salinivirga sp.]